MTSAVLRMKDEKVGFISRDRHFVDLLRSYAGDDAAQFYEDRMKDIQSEIEEICEGLTEYANPLVFKDKDINEIRSGLLQSIEELKKVAILE